MAANPEEWQPLDTYPGIKLPRNLDTVRRIRMATAQVLRAMGERKVSVYTGKAMVQGLGQLHEMVMNERAPANPGTTVNIAMVAGADSPVAQVARRLLGTGATVVDAGSFQDEPVPVADDRTGEA